MSAAIQVVVGENVMLVSSAEETAFDVYRTLMEHGIQHSGLTTTGKYRFEATGASTEQFLRLARRFLGPEVLSVELVETGVIHLLKKDTP